MKKTNPLLFVVCRLRMLHLNTCSALVVFQELKLRSQRVLGTFIVECRVSMLGISLVIWVSPIVVPRSLC